MLNTLQKWLDRLDLDPEKTSLRTLLPTINVVLVLLVIIGISFSAIGLLRKLANEQGLSQVQLAGATAREELRKIGEDNLKQARRMAADATLRRLLQDAAPDLSSVLRRACTAAGMDACAVVRGDTLLLQTEARTKPEPALTDAYWQAVLIAAHEQGERFGAVPSAVLPPAAGATAVVQDEANGQSTRLYALRFIDDKLAALLSERVGLKVTLVNYRVFSTAAADNYTRLNSAALSDGRSAAERINSLDVFAASIPLFASTGEAIALLQTELTTDSSDANIRALTNRLLITAIVVGALAILVSLLLGQLVARPVQDLTNAASRLSQGDFSTSIPTGGPAEIGVLSRTMENMRRNLVDLTSTLRRSEAEAQAVLSGTIEGVYAVDKLRRITYMNPQGARMLGVNAEQVIGKFCGDVLKPCVDKSGNRPCDSQCPILQARASDSAQATEHLQIGDERVIAAVITSAGLVDGLQVQVLRNETELEAIRRARDAVLANISHEFRTPLAAQLASIELLLDGLEHMPTEQTRELVLSLERSTQRLTALIDNLLESVRIESGQLNIRQQSVALSEVVAESQALIGSLLAQREQKLLIDVPDELPNVSGDELRLTQVFVNLLANANKYAPQGSTIRIGAQVAGEQLQAWVEDEGPGVPDAELGAIFNRFSRGVEQEPEPGGLGLGLWIVKSIIERHGGQITAIRTAEQRTRFSLALPLARDDT